MPDPLPPRLIGQPPRKPPPAELEFFADAPEQCCNSVDRTGLRPQLERAFQEAIARARSRPRP